MWHEPPECNVIPPCLRERPAKARERARCTLGRRHMIRSASSCGRRQSRAKWCTAASLQCREASVHQAVCTVHCALCTVQCAKSTRPAHSAGARSLHCRSQAAEECMSPPRVLPLRPQSPPSSCPSCLARLPSSATCSDAKKRPGRACQ